ncbi:tetratricopeptide repeat protein [Pontibacillus salicampi]|uniref:Tetratricopeptide repeat protein n=1 Tax=Pontibacillus salicampi TaxID=1449801 RepID=A0ABV6LPL6_9BACI
MVKTDVGKKIKFHRLNQNRTLEETADGICSLSYLSKIENGLTKSSEEIVRLLYNRLNIDYEVEEVGMDEDHVEQELHEWYHMIIQRRSDQATEQYLQFKQSMEQHSSPGILALFQLFEIRYQLLMRHLNEVPILIEKVNRMKEMFEEKHQYYLYKFTGIYHHMSNQYRVAQEQFSKAMTILNRSPMSDFEKSDIYFGIAINELRLLNITLSIHYSRLALDLYSINFDFHRSADCQILLGICYKRIHQFDQAEEAFHLAIKAANHLQEPSLKGVAYQNLGEMYSAMGRNEEAIQHYEKSLVFKENHNIKGKLTTIASMVEALFAFDEKARLMEWIDRGIMMVEGKPDYQLFHYFFQVYKMRVEGDTISLEHYLRESVIPYFEGIDDRHYLAIYAELLSQCLQASKKYKDACYYLSLANDSYKQLSKT